jgi:hypothetical protein
MFNMHQLGIVAYASVVGATGLSPNTNSGVGTTRIAVGQYAVILPAGQGLASKDDLIFVQIKGSVTGISSAETDTDQNIKLVYIGSSSTTAVDADFDIVVFRSLLPTSAGIPA